MTTLTTEQQEAVDQAVAAIGRNELYKIGGYAGTGKTTVARYIADQVPGCMAAAFTGKAAYRLTQKGLPASTIHQHIYEYNEKTKGGLRFFKKDDVEGDWFLIDEGSMIPRDVWDDLMSFKKPILLLGDPGQLEPVGADPRLMHKPDIVLEKIHRQAAESGIIQFATDIRHGAIIKLGNASGRSLYPDVDIYYGKSAHATVKDLRWADIMICAFNRTRIRINRTYRTLWKYPLGLCEGERIVVLRNNRQFGVFNGQILRVVSVGDRAKGPVGIIKTICRADDGHEVELPLWADQFGAKPIQDWNRNDVVLADWAYAITCHKSQGSEWPRVVVIDEQCSAWDATRWRYTAITRASKELRYFTK